MIRKGIILISLFVMIGVIALWVWSFTGENEIRRWSNGRQIKPGWQLGNLKELRSNDGRFYYAKGMYGRFWGGLRLVSFGLSDFKIDLGVIALWKEQGRIWNCRTQLWLIILVLVILPAYFLIVVPFLRRRKRRMGLCVECGYDLRGTTADVCPECGTSSTCPECGMAIKYLESERPNTESDVFQ